MGMDIRFFQALWERIPTKSPQWKMLRVKKQRVNVCNCLIILRINGAPGEIRTPDPLVRSQVLYPTELRAQI